MNNRKYQLKGHQLLFLSFFFAVVALSGCGKEGPAGPIGPTGAAGPNGNAQITVTTLTSSNWYLNEPSWLINLDVPAITEEILNTGVIIAYMKIGDHFHQLPSTFYFSNQYSVSFGVSSTLNTLRVSQTRSDWGWGLNPGSQTFKVVVMTASARKQQPELNFADYEAVRIAYTLE